jgi:hypothetical protein
VTGDWKRMCNMSSRNFYSSQRIMSATKSKEGLSIRNGKDKTRMILSRKV